MCQKREEREKNDITLEIFDSISLHGAFFLSLSLLSRHCGPYLTQCSDNGATTALNISNNNKAKLKNYIKMSRKKKKKKIDYHIFIYLVPFLILL